MMITESEISKILVEFWDPVEISQNINLHDEYDEIAAKVLQVIFADNCEELMRNLLLNEEIGMGINPIDNDRVNRTVRRLMEMRQ